MKKIFFCTVFLCENNGYFGTQIWEFFKKNSYFLVNKSKEADTIIINTCAVTEQAENKCLDVINHYIKRYGTSKQIIIYGCLPKINLPIAELQGVTCISPHELKEFNVLFPHTVPIEEISANILNKNFTKSYDKQYSVMISQGCINNCSYCAIKKAKGDLVSKPAKKILEEINKGISLGYKNIKLVADDCGCYGVDIKTNLGELLRQIRAINADFCLEFHYIEPLMFLRHYDEISKIATEKSIEHINIPIQTGSQRILKLMNRHYDIGEVVEKIKELKRSVEIHVASDIIMGFPSETVDEFKKTLEIASVFDKVEMFLYSPRKGTQAASLTDNLSPEELKYRHNVALDLERKNPEKYHYSGGDEKNVARSVYKT